jgi:hypothetical protein
MRQGYGLVRLCERYGADKVNALCKRSLVFDVTFVANALGHVACHSGFNVILHRGDDLLRLLRQSRLDNSLEPMTRDESRDIYQLFVERTGKAATIITSNRDTADWLAVFDDPLLGQGAVDRFKNNAYDLVVDGESYRSRLKPSVDKDGPPPAAPVTKPTPLLRRRRRARGQPLAGQPIDEATCANRNTAEHREELTCTRTSVRYCRQRFEAERR